MTTISPVGVFPAQRGATLYDTPAPEPIRAGDGVQGKAHEQPKKNDKPLDLRDVAKALIRNTFDPKVPKGKGTQASHSGAPKSKEDRQKEKEAKLLGKVISNLEAFSENPEQVQPVMALLQEADGSGADGVLNALRQAKDMLWTAKADSALRNSPTILAGPVESWTPYQRSVNKLVKSVATLERFEMRSLTQNVLDRMPAGSPDLPEAGALRRLIDQMVFFSVDDLDRLHEVKAGLSAAASGGLATLQDAVEGLRRPRLDELVRNAGATFAGKTYEQLSPTEVRLAKLVTALQKTHLEWAKVVEGVVVPKPAEVPASGTA